MIFIGRIVPDFPWPVTSISARLVRHSCYNLLDFRHSARYHRTSHVFDSQYISIAGPTMALIKSVERKIRDVEGFNVIIRHPHGGNVRSDREDVPQYSAGRAAKDDMTVEGWKSNRFRPSYPGFDVDVLDGHGSAVPGNTKLATVRESYHL